ncbi:MAG: leucyl aminopeptidase [Bacillota bacterium]|nr:leucyl aminopeptidase [Bacillota bacterium]
MQEAIYSFGARKLVENVGNIKPHEKVLIVSDFAMKVIAERLTCAVSAIGAECVVCYMKPREWDCQEPPEMIAEAMKKADVILTPVSVSIAWTNAITNAKKNGARVMLMTGFTDEIFARPALVLTNFQEQAKLCAKLADIYDKASRVRLYTEKGTDFTFEKQGRYANKVGPIPVSGECRAAPDIEINIVPIEGTSQGKLVVDGSIPYLGIGVLDTSVEFVVKDGLIVSITGDRNAQKLADNLAQFENQNVYNIAEFGIGLNPNACLSGVMLEDEGVFGTVHIGIGSSCHFGGLVDAPIHYDLLIKNVCIELDGKLIQRGREIFFD